MSNKPPNQTTTPQPQPGGVVTRALRTGTFSSEQKPNLSPAPTNNSSVTKSPSQPIVTGGTSVRDRSKTIENRPAILPKPESLKKLVASQSPQSATPQKSAESAPSPKPELTPQKPAEQSPTQVTADQTPISSTEPASVISGSNEAELEQRWLAAEARIKELEEKLRSTLSIADELQKQLEEAEKQVSESNYVIPAPPAEEESGGPPPPPPPAPPAPPPPPGGAPAPATGAKADLMSAIRAGTKLKKAPKPEDRKPEDKPKEKAEGTGAVFSMAEMAANMAKKKGALEKKVEIVKTKSQPTINLDPELSKKLSLRGTQLDKLKEMKAELRAQQSQQQNQ